MNLKERWREWRQRRQEYADTADEMRLHIELETERNIRLGMDPESARRAAGTAFGGVDRFVEQARDERTGSRLSDFVVSTLDFKLGYRMLVRYPGLTLVGGLAMAFAIMMGAAGFEVVMQLVDPKLPFPDGDRVIAIRNWDVRTNQMQSRIARDFEYWREQAKTVEQLGAYRLFERNLLIPGRSTEAVPMAEISPSAFDIARVAPLLGRTLRSEDERADAPLVAVLGHDIWQARFDSDRAVIGRAIGLGADRAIVVGVMPAGFGFPFSQSLWVPLRLNALQHNWGEGPALGVFGRLAPRATLEQAQAELDALGRRISSEQRATHTNVRTQLMPYVESIFSFRISGLVRALSLSSNLFFVLFLLLICANVALLMFARAAARESEMVVRNALGASRARIVSQLVAEALVLAGLAAAIGLPVANLALRAARSMMEVNAGRLPFWWDATLSWRSMLWAVGLAALGALVAGSMPALKVTRGLGTRLRQVGAGGGGLRFGAGWTAIIIAQVTLTGFLVGMTLYLAQLSARIQLAEYGFASEQYLSARLVPDQEIDRLPFAEGRWQWPASTEAFRARYAEIERRLEAESGVLGVTHADIVPGLFHARLAIQLDTSALPAGTPPATRVQRARVGLDFFEELNGRILAGRTFNAGDFAADRRVVVVNESFVRDVLGGRNAIGQQLRFQVDESDDPWGPWFEIVGVVADLRMTIDPELPRQGLYLPEQPAEGSYLIVHYRGQPQAHIARVRAIVAAVDPLLRLHELGPLEDFKNQELSFYRIATRAMIGASLLVLALSLAGIYSIMSFTVARRTREIGIRLALGADRRRLMTSIFARPFAQAASGILIAVAIIILMSEQLGWRAILILSAFTLFMLAVVTSACVVPIRRALAVQPTETLRASE